MDFKLEVGPEKDVILFNIFDRILQIQLNGRVSVNRVFLQILKPSKVFGEELIHRLFSLRLLSIFFRFPSVFRKY